MFAYHDIIFFLYNFAFLDNMMAGILYVGFQACLPIMMLSFICFIYISFFIFYLCLHLFLGHQEGIQSGSSVSIIQLLPKHTICEHPEFDDVGNGWKACSIC